MQSQRAFTYSNLFYLSTASLAASILIAMYAVQGFTGSRECATESGESLTNKMVITFRVCFYTHFVEFFNYAFLGPLLQVLLRTRVAMTAREKKISEFLALASLSLEAVLRGLVLLLVFWQIFLLAYNEHQACFDSAD